MNRVAIASCVCLLLVIAVSCGDQNGHDGEDVAHGEQDELERTAAAYADLNEYLNSYDYSLMWLDYTTENGETDYHALYVAVTDRCERIVGRHGFESVDQWLEALGRYAENDLVSSTRAGYESLADDVLEELREYDEHGYPGGVPEEPMEFEEEPPVRFDPDGTGGGPYITSTGDDDGASSDTGEK